MKSKYLQMKMTAMAVLMALLLGAIGMTKGFAYDFSAVCETGQTLYFNIIDVDNHYVELTCPGEANYSNCWAEFDKPTGDIVLPESVQYEEVTYTVTSIGNYAFCYCNGLSGSLTIPNSITTIGYCAFESCRGFTGSLTIGNSVSTIGVGAFDYCDGFTGSLTIGNSVTKIDSLAFSFCSFTGDLIIPNSVTEIGCAAFQYCGGFTGDLTIPNSVITMGDLAFTSCHGFTGSLTIGNSVTEIGDYAFMNCAGFNGSLIIGNSVTKIDSCAFAQSGFTGDLIIPNSVTEIAGYAFRNCTGFSGHLTIGNSVTTIGEGAFWNCPGFTGLTLGNSVETIRDLAFMTCRGFTGDLIIPNSVTTIGGQAFFGCGFRGSLIIGNSVTTIGYRAFMGSFTEMMMLGMTPPAIASILGTYPIYVPYESLNAYKTATNWSSYESRIHPWLQKSIPAHGTNESPSGWTFIGSPLTENTAPTAIDSMIAATANDYDLYRFNQSEAAEWENHKAHTNDFVLENGKGYLYANAEDVNLVFKGEFNENDTKTVTLTYDQDKHFAGWNLVGNPFPVNAYANKSYYRMNDDGSAIYPTAISTSTAIAPCTGIMVKAETTGESVTFSKTVPNGQGNQGVLQIAVAQYNTRGASAGSATDKAIVSFNEGDQLGKFYFGESKANLYLPQNGKDYAIAFSKGQSEIPLNFKANENGIYTILINPEGVELAYLHLIDNMTGADVDLLQNPSYNFNAKTTDYESRFKLVFASVCEDADSDSDSDADFAFISDGNLIINGEGMLQVIDMQGRVIRNVGLSQRVSRTTVVGMTPGVYMLRLVNGEKVRTQKIVVK